MIVHVTNLIRPVNHTFPTVSLELSFVCRRSLVTQYARINHVNQHIVTLLPEHLGSTRQTITEKTEIKSYIIIMNTLPSTVEAWQLAIRIDIRHSSIA